ncbi:MAG: 2-C-methyl-D-erythritol 4-phosphate cytidylyltransferase, partial [Desulfobacteraceae bacterium]|nr:2-C-methyl-D-erythritol 4-phosphate cytidylyltransferase [Desulfobacteraceae bacterium]
KKQYLPLDNIPILSHTLMKFEQYCKPHKIILVVPENDIKYCKESILKPLGMEKKVIIVPGGKERQQSVLNGINRIKTLTDNYDKDILLIHDGVRPFIDAFIIDECIKGAIESGACVPAIKVVDTLKIVNNNVVTKTLNRDYIYQIQTPQGFLLKIIVDAMEYAENKKFSGTDEASVVEFFGHKVVVIKGSKRNIKITTKEDLEFAKMYLAF